MSHIGLDNEDLVSKLCYWSFVAGSAGRLDPHSRHSESSDIGAFCQLLGQDFARRDVVIIDAELESADPRPNLIQRLQMVRWIVEVTPLDLDGKRSQTLRSLVNRQFGNGSKFEIRVWDRESGASLRWSVLHLILH